MAKSQRPEPEIYKAPRNLGKKRNPENPKWLVPTFTTLLVMGPVWIIVYYISRAQYPLPIGNTNLIVGFGFLFAGLALITRWK